MKWTTANVKHPNYTDNHEIYVGTQTGSFKKIILADEEKPFAARNLLDLKDLDKDSRITALAFGDAEQSQILIGRANRTVQLLAAKTGEIENAVDVAECPVVGLARFEDILIAGFGNGHIQHLSLNTEESSISPILLVKSGDDMAHLRQCPTQRNLVATGGKGRQNNLKVFDMVVGKQLFTSKNLPNDYLQLEVPVWDSDIGFIDSPNVLATCSRHGYVRVYDTRKQRRPVQLFSTEDQLSFSTLIARGNYIYTGTTMGALKAFDIRRMKTFVHTYKGFTGAISDLHLDGSGKCLASASLDRYVRVHNVDSTVLLYQCYVKSKAMRLLIGDSLEKSNSNASAEEEEEEQDDDVKVATNENEASEDEEYNEMFENMQTIREKGENDNEDSEDQNKEEESQKPTQLKAGDKRKSTKNQKKNKKKKN